MNLLILFYTVIVDQPPPPPPPELEDESLTSMIDWNINGYSLSSGHSEDSDDSSSDESSEEIFDTVW